MIEKAYVVMMAGYNRWQNENVYGAAAGLADEERRRDRGAFFGSIHGTLNHLLWADEVWLGRFTGRAHPRTPIKESSERFADWEELRAERVALDAVLVAWAEALDPAWLARTAPAAKGSRAAPSRSNAFLVAHVFNHQTHHRGQVHAMLTAAGARPGDTDLLKLVGREERRGER